MTAIRLLSAGLMATTLLATPVIARENVTGHYVTGNANASAPTARSFDRHAGITDQHGGTMAAPPDGENCDVGDNPFIC